MSNNTNTFIARLAPRMRRTRRDRTNQSRQTPMGRTAMAAVATVCAASGALLWGASNDSASAASTGDGTTSLTAGASCWGVKQQFPASPDGIYWIQTPQLGAARQFRCDMTTDGGGWVLVGRGRDGWWFGPDGQGSESTLRTTFEGTGAFAPAALSSDTIDQLLGGTALKSLDDGVRIKRARNETGTLWDEWRFKFATRSTWTWAFGGGWALSETTINGVPHAGGNTRDTAIATNGNVATGLAGVDNPRMVTSPMFWGNNSKGFYGGDSIKGSNSATTYIFNPDGTRGMGFTQVWIRPKLGSSTWASIPAAGLPASVRAAGLSNKAAPFTWGVTGLDRTDEERVEPWKTPVMDIEVAGGRAFVGGRFAEVRQGATGTPVPQRFLAAFDESSGDFIDTFRPAVNGRVWDIVEGPNNTIIIGGDFTNVNGEPNTAGLAMLNQTNGSVVTSWKANVRRDDGTGRRAIVRALDVQGGYLYAAGNFNRYQGGTWNQINVGRAVRVNLTNASPDGAWRPSFPGSPVDMDVSANGDRVYLVGFFKSTNGDATKRFFVTVNNTSGAIVTGLQQWSGEQNYGDRYQQTVLEVGDRVFVGGAEHILQMLNRADLSRLESAIATRGGDLQESTLLNGKLYAACHCGDFLFRSAMRYTDYPSSFTESNRINYVGAFDPTTMVQDDRFLPELNGSGDGVWALEGDSSNCLWIGGQITQSAARWAGGFAKFCPQDVAAPATPANLSATVVNGNDVQLKWTKNADDTNSYWVYRDDRPIAEVWTNTFTDLDITGSHVYWVAAVDQSANRSATTPGVSAGLAPPAAPQLIPLGSMWTWATGGPAIGANWITDGFQGQTAPAQFGWGDGDEATIIPSATIDHYFRRDVQIPADASLKAIKVNLKRDDGAAVYLDNFEVLRSNLPEGDLTPSTTATDYTSGAGENQMFSQVVPLGIGLGAGTHSVSTELHQRTAGNADGSFDLSIEQLPPSTDAEAPSIPDFKTPVAGTDAVTLSWTASTDNVSVAGYVVTGPGFTRIVPASQITVTDSALTAGTTATYTVRAFDAAGNLSATREVVAGPNGPLALIARKADWKWSYSAIAPPAEWAQPAFDDRTWASGNAELGYGDNDEATKISPAAATYPITAYFRKAIQVTDPAAFSQMVMNVIRDDGVVVYVNGVEVGRNNMPAGPVDPATSASTGVDLRADETTPISITAPTSAFRAGTNVIAVEVHNIHKWSGDLSFDLELLAKP